ncbi:MAG: DUF63 family protein [Halobacteriota archaeon]|uniref:DUF63 family protein n=1 Tax=Natronomonas sp. TaxID=2184060 RepID=UPI003974BF22
MVLPTGFSLPALPYLAALVVAIAVALAALNRRRPPVTAATVTALTPWMAGGGALYALYQARIPPDSIAPLFGSPAVYVTTGVLASLLWAAVADRPADTWEPTGAPAILAGCGSLVLLVAVAIAAVGPTPNTVGASPIISIVILIVSIGVAAAVWTGVRSLRDVHATGTVGASAVFGHTLDGVSTAVGYDLLGFGEQTPLSRLIIEAGAALPTAELIGAGWLFALVKVGLGALIVVLFEEYVRAEPTEGYLLLGLVVAVGLGPGAHNLVLFAIA